MRNGKAKKLINLRMDISLLNRLRKEAGREHVTMTRIIEEALRAKLALKN